MNTRKNSSITGRFIRYAAFAVVAWGFPASLATAQPMGTFAPPAILNTNATMDAADDEAPVVTSDGRGTFVAVWSTRKNNGGPLEDDLYFARSEDGGATWSDPAILNSNAADDDGATDASADLATDGVGNWIVVWSSQADLGGTIEDDFDILYAVSGDNGRSWSDPAALNSTAANDTGGDGEPTIATDGVGRWVVAWTSFDTLGNSIGGDADILVSYSDDDGEAWSNAQPLNAYAATDNPAMDGDQAPFLTTDGAGLWLAIWSSGYDLGDTIGNDRDIVLSRSTDGGKTWSAAVPLNTTAADDGNDDDYPARAATDGRGHWVAVWQSSHDLGGAIGDDLDILYATSDDNGETWSDPNPLHVSAATDVVHELDPEVKCDGNGLWVAFWRTGFDEGAPMPGPFGSDMDVMYAVSADDGASWSVEMPVDPNAAIDNFIDRFACLATDTLGNWVAIWDAVDLMNADLGDDRDLRFVRFALPDANGNGMGDAQELSDGLADDCDEDGLPDDASADCNKNGILDACDLATMINFSAGNPLASGAGPVAVIAVDVNGDMELDLVVGSEDPSVLTFLISDGAGGFDAPIEFALGMGITAIVAADLDGDMLPDLALASIFDSRVYFLLNDGGIDAILNGDSPSYDSRDVGDAPLAIVAADFDGVNGVDIATADGDVSVLLNKGDGTFDPAVEYAAGTIARGLAAADLDGDGDVDLASAAAKDNAAAILLNAGDGTFDEPKLYAAGADVWGITAADLDGDGDADLVTADADLDDNVGPPDTVSVLENLGDGTFAAAKHFGVGEAPRTVIAADLDGDGDLDLAVSNRVSDDVTILRNAGGLRFLPAQTVDVGDFPQSLVAFDMDEDFLPELAVVNQFDDNVSLLLNRLLLPVSMDADGNGTPDDCSSDDGGMNGGNGMNGGTNGGMNGDGSGGMNGADPMCCAVGVPGASPIMVLGIFAMKLRSRGAAAKRHGRAG